MAFQVPRSVFSLHLVVDRLGIGQRCFDSASFFVTVSLSMTPIGGYRGERL